MKRLFGTLFWILVRHSRSDRLSRALGRLYLRLRPFVLFAGTPEDQEVRSAFCTIDGWFAWDKASSELSLRLSRTPVSYLPVKRPDVTRIFGEEHCVAFRAFFEVSRFLTEQVRSNLSLELELVANGQTLAIQPFQLREQAIKQADTSAPSRAAKREWLLNHLTVPAKDDDGPILDFLPSELRNEFQIDGPTALSAHAYDEVAKDIIEDVRRAGGKVLDCGSGLRANVDETVICVEVTPLPTVDVLAVNQRLPFRDGVFDAVLSLNVLEHVTDPFACAAELVRVLKPGGVLYCCIPFLQPEHGYPHHYFNATRSGLRQLFRTKLEPVRIFVPRSGEPVWTLSWFLESYAAELPVEERQRFLNLRLWDLIRAPAQSLLDKNWVKLLSEAGKWELASTTAAVFRKPH
jgi:SAM-dependent methyltransferase